MLIVSRRGEFWVDRFCAKHWVARQGEASLDKELQTIEALAEYDSMQPSTVSEITKIFPTLAKKYTDTLLKIVRHALERHEDDAEDASFSR